MNILSRGKGERKGFTLVETLVSILIFSIAFISLLGTFVVGRVSATKAKHRIIAMNLLRAQMERVKGQGYDWIDTNVVGVGNEIIENDVDDTIGQDELLNDTRTTTATRDANNNLVVTITLNWEKRIWGGTTAKGTAANPDEQIVTLIGVP